MPTPICACFFAVSYCGIYLLRCVNLWGRKCLKKRPRPEGVRRRNSRNSLLINLHSSVTTIRRWVRTEVIHSVTSFFLGKSELFCRVPCNEIFPVGTDDLSLTLCSAYCTHPSPLPILLASHATTCTQFARRERRTSDAKKLRHCHAFGAGGLFSSFPRYTTTGPPLLLNLVLIDVYTGLATSGM